MRTEDRVQVHIQHGTLLLKGETWTEVGGPVPDVVTVRHQGKSLWAVLVDQSDLDDIMRWALYKVCEEPEFIITD